MIEYKINSYQPGIEEKLLEISKDVVKDWVWPFHFALQDFKDLKDKTATHIVFTCSKGEIVVGYIFARIGIPVGVVGPSIIKDRNLGASLFSPRVLLGCEECSEMLMEKVLDFSWWML